MFFHVFSNSALTHSGKRLGQVSATCTVEQLVEQLRGDHGTEAADALAVLCCRGEDLGPGLPGDGDASSRDDGGHRVRRSAMARYRYGARPCWDTGKFSHRQGIC